MRLLKIGRDASNNIVLHSEKASSLHAEITLMDNGDIMLEDKGSHNGTFIQNRPIKPGVPVSIRRGDAIRFADVELIWSQVPMPEDNSAYKAIYGVGSHLNNDIQITGDTVSRYHATIKVGKDNKVYIFDHSKNGTTVDGRKIQPNTPVRIKKSSAIVCGRVPLNLQNSPIQWPSNFTKIILLSAASLLVLVCIVIGAKMINPNPKPDTYTDEELYSRYKNSVVMMFGIYHYNVTVGDLDLNKLNEISKKLGLISQGFYFPSKVFLSRNQNNQVYPVLNASGASSKEIVEYINKQGELGLYTGTGFFISNDGKLITNLHIVKPWLFGDNANMLEEYKSELTRKLSQFAEILVSNKISIGLSAYISQLKVEGELDYVSFISQGEIFDPDNAVKCKVLSAGDDPNKDVALVQTISKRLPTSDCTYVNVMDSMDVTDDALKVGHHIYTIGFPFGKSIQFDKEKGIQVIAQGGDITQQNSEFDFAYNAATFGGASGSPVFNEYGMLIGVHHAGLSQAGVQGYNYGIKAKYVKELLDSAQ